MSPKKKTSWQDLVSKAVQSQNAKRASSLRPEWRRFGDQRKIDLIVVLNGCRVDDGDEVAEALSANSASFVKFMTRDDSFLLHCLTACIETGCASQRVFTNMPLNLYLEIVKKQRFCRILLWNLDNI